MTTLGRHNLHEYQNTGHRHLMHNPYSGLFKEMGLGKTVTTLTAINDLKFNAMAIDSSMVIAPLQVATGVWKQEAAKWEHLKHLKVQRVTGTARQRMRALESKADIYLMGRENTAWLCGKYGGTYLPFDHLVLDESSSFKNSNSERFKALRRAIPSTKRVTLLTGTPAPNGLMDLWAQIYLLDRGQRLGRTITAYRHRFFTNEAPGYAQYPKYVPKEGAAEAIYEAISDICLSMKAADYLTLPPRIETFTEVPMSEAARAAYKQFERDRVLEWAEEVQTSGEVAAMSAAALITKLLQFSSGAVYDDERNVQEIHNSKLDILGEKLEALQGAPVLIAWAYQHDRDRILKKFGKKFGAKQFSGHRDIAKWNAGKIPAMLMHPASGGHGLNLQQGGNRVLWFGPTWSLEYYQQLNARIDRQGQKANNVFVDHFLTKGTVEERVYASLKRKAEDQDDVMRALAVDLLAEYT